MRALLALSRDRETQRALEADLRREYHVDLRGLWQRDEAGRRRLTLRQLASFVTGLPPDSATARAVGGDGLTMTDVLLMDIFHAQAGKPHPSRPSGRGDVVASAEKAERLRKAKRRAAQRRRAIERGEIT